MALPYPVAVLRLGTNLVPQAGRQVANVLRHALFNAQFRATPLTIR